MDLVILSKLRPEGLSFVPPTTVHLRIHEDFPILCPVERMSLLDGGLLSW
jgi:hypothetical protein